LHAKRKTLFPKDIRLVENIISIWDPTSWLAKHKTPVTRIDWNQVKRVMPLKRGMPRGIVSRVTKVAPKKVDVRKDKGKS
jgi:hypothetical protein